VGRYPDRVVASISSSIAHHFSFPGVLQWELEMEQHFANRLTTWKPAFHIKGTQMPVQLVGGSLLSDRRFSTILSSAFDIHPPETTTIKEPQISRDATHFGWALSYVTKNRGMHLFVMQHPAMIVGMLGELGLPTGTLRLSLLGCTRSFCVRQGPYQAQPAMRAKAICGMYQSVPVPVGNNKTLQISLLLRSVTDDYLGNGLSIVGKIAFHGKHLTCSFQRWAIPLYPGALLLLAYTTEDQPMNREIGKLHFRMGNFQTRFSYTDTKWRLTPYAQDAQRRVFSAHAHLSYQASHSFSPEVSLYYQKRWNRSGTIGSTVRGSIPLSFRIHSVDIEVKPEVCYGVSTQFSLELKSTYFVGAQRTLEILCKFTRTNSDLYIVYTHSFSEGKLQIRFGSDQSLSFTYAISQ
jgi:hypothetical protein